MKSEPIMMTPGRAGYLSVNRSGRHGSLRDWKAVGRSYASQSAVNIPRTSVLTWTNAVAIKTPVPKCLQKKNTFGGIFIHLTFFATTGNPAPPIEAANTITVNH
jgi:hypothetical protein